MSGRSELKKILLVEDDQDLRAIARFSLEKVGGYEVMVCAAGEEAVAACTSYLPDLILMDYTLPDINGVEALRRIGEHSRGGDTPKAVIFSAGRGGESPPDISGISILGSISKPFDPMSLPSALKDMWEGVEGP